MKYVCFVCYCFLLIPLCNSQELSEKAGDSLYREDQFYIGITYNLLGKKPAGVTQSGFSFGLHLGFIRDMPINKKRNKAFGIGLGYSTNGYNQNILMSRGADGKFDYELLGSSGTYSRNKFNTHVIELPIQYRWRTSTPSDYAFWRVYAGVKLGYMVSNISRYKGELGNLTFYNNQDFNDFQYGLTLSAGYNTWNFHVYYGLNNLLDGNAKLNGGSIDMNAIKLGLMFYIL
ncbi:porin family protein [Cognatitamlana onchidii]|uniref:porin family protein n=1 Tax=Cognatitamlana onchidii TaxID=2562860 RepID=UPI0010A6A51B|nr:porin family protein [Algibacter onchidii]